MRSSFQRRLVFVFASLNLHGWGYVLLDALGEATPLQRVAQVGAAPVSGPSEPLTLELLPVERQLPPPTRVGGGRENIDSGQRGSRETGGSEAQLIWFVDQASTVTAQPEPANNERQASAQRLRTATTRASLDNRRATPNPELADQVTTGRGRSRERQRSALEQPGHGNARQDLRAAARASVTAELALRRRGPNVGEATPTTALRGVPRSLRRRGGARERMATLRPSVLQGAASVPAPQRAWQPRDRRNSHLRALPGSAAHMVASPAFSPLRAAGRGGAQAVFEGGSTLGPPESGLALGYGAPAPARYVRWYAQQQRRVARALRFPRERRLALDQGLAVYRVRVGRDGSLLAPPVIIRSSGYEDFDEEAARAIERSAPFAPLPSTVARGQPALALSFAIEFSNPMIR